MQISDQNHLKLCEHKVRNERQKVKKIFGCLHNIEAPFKGFLSWATAQPSIIRIQ